VAGPNRLWVSDFTCVATWVGFVYVAFVIDAFARRIVGWRASRAAHAGFVLDALEQALHDRQSEYLPENTICILDLFHVLERLWKVAWCLFDEKTQKRAAHQWVEERLRRLLEGKVDAVIRGMRYQATQRGLKGPKRKTVHDAAAYFERNRDRMRYDAYLAAG
jgi:hypothetical protein